MRKINLPTLKNIKIKNFTLYPNALDFSYDFINGVNLIIGGNGMGKTTFVNIIKYAIIGNYSKNFDYSRTYLEKKIEGRKSYPGDYFKNRLDTSISKSSEASVTIEFEINKNIFIVERNLENVQISSVKFNNTDLEGEIISQKKYDNIKADKEKYLNFVYEQKVAEVSGMSFDDLIFFVNEILFFGENHKTVLWGDEFPNVQDELFNKYFNSPELDYERQEALRQAKYFDSISRHKSEDIRAIQNVLKKVTKKDSNTEEDEDINKRILKLKNNIEKYESSIENIQKERLTIDDKIRLLNNRANELSLKEAELGKNKNTIENKLFEKKWVRLHKHYHDYLQNLKTNKFCPMCNNELEDEFVLEKINHSNNCFLCDHSLNNETDEELNNEFAEYENNARSIYIEIQNILKEIKGNEILLQDLDKDFRFIDKERRKLKTDLRNLEFERVKDYEQNSDELQAFYDEIESLENQKIEFQEKSKKEKSKAESISKIIEESIIKNAIKFSNLFSEYAQNFLGVECSLAYTDAGSGKKRFIPKIDGKIRYYEEELSESQRFFIDHSFRMSILTFFYNSPTFYIVETPDSSLDISYEKNAAEVFSKFLERPNSLIITSNLNNSDFLNHLIEIAQVKMISLIELGKKSIIQNASSALQNIYSQLKSKVKV